MSYAVGFFLLTLSLLVTFLPFPVSYQFHYRSFKFMNHFNWHNQQSREENGNKNKEKTLEKWMRHKNNGKKEKFSLVWINEPYMPLTVLYDARSIHQSCGKIHLQCGIFSSLIIFLLLGRPILYALCTSSQCRPTHIFKQCDTQIFWFCFIVPQMINYIHSHLFTRTQYFL